jgi:hypothetical protein
LGVIDSQGAPILVAPHRIQVEDAGDHPLIGCAKAIAMALVKGSRRKDGVVNLELDEAEEQSLIQGQPQPFDLRSVDVLDGGWCFLVPPEDHVSADF